VVLSDIVSIKECQRFSRPSNFRRMAKCSGSNGRLERIPAPSMSRYTQRSIAVRGLVLYQYLGQSSKRTGGALKPLRPSVGFPPSRSPWPDEVLIKFLQFRVRLESFAYRISLM